MIIISASASQPKSRWLLSSFTKHDILPWIWSQGFHRLSSWPSLAALWAFFRVSHFAQQFYAAEFPCEFSRWSLLRKPSKLPWPLFSAYRERVRATPQVLSSALRFSATSAQAQRSLRSRSSRWNCAEFADEVDRIMSWFVGNLTISHPYTAIDE